jgi:hypothetical protein
VVASVGGVRGDHLVFLDGQGHPPYRSRWREMALQPRSPVAPSNLYGAAREQFARRLGYPAFAR